MEKTAVERERVFRLKNIREETVESDDDGLFVEKPVAIEELPEPEVEEDDKKGKKKNKKAKQYDVDPDEEFNREQA